MKTVLITGSTRGLGYEMSKCFRLAGWNVVMNGVNKQRLEQAVKTMQDLPGDGTAEGICGNVANGAEVQALADFALEHFLQHRYLDQQCRG